MKRNVMRMTVAIVLLGMVLFLSACGKSEPEQAASDKVQQDQVQVSSQGAEETFELHGDYAIDITDLGMALTFYLRIAADNSFVLSANRQFSDDRGSGTIGELDGTYLMIYSDSTPEKSKTATFERVGPNLLFQSTLPYGSANISFERVDEDDPDLVYRLMADKYVYEEYYDTYLGYQSVGELEYDYVLTLGPGAKYSLVSTMVKGEAPSYEEKGSFRVAGESIFITPQGAAELQGAVTEDRGLELDVKPEESLDRTPILFRVATTAAHAGRWYAEKNGTAAELTLDYFGGYSFESQSHAEKGRFDVTQQTISFTKAGETGPVEGTKAGYELKAMFAGQEWNFYGEAIQGQFTGGTMVNETYSATLQMNADGSYALEVLDQESGLELVRESGGFAITAGPMAYMITLTSRDETLRVGEIWPTGLNMTLDIGGTKYSFLLTK